MAQGNIGSILNAGRDAYNNIYDIVINFPTAFFSSSGDLSSTDYSDLQGLSSTYRVRTGNITLPTLELSSYEVGYKTEKIKVGGAKITGEKKLSFPLRIDGNWNLFTLFYKWNAIFGSPADGSVSLWSTKPDWLGSIQVITPVISSIDSLTQGIDFSDFSKLSTFSVKFNVWQFNEVWLKSFESPSFTRESDTPVTITPSFNFGHMGYYESIAYTDISSLSKITEY